MTSPELAEQLALIAAYVRDEGRVALDVVDPDREEPDYTYSIGFPVSVGQPEAVVFGLPQDLRRSIIHTLWHMLRDDGLTLEDGLRIGGLLAGFDCILREVTDRDIIDTYLAAAVDYHDSQHGAVVDRVFQIVWPDAASGLFPWDAGCAEAVIFSQPALYSVSLNS